MKPLRICNPHYRCGSEPRVITALLSAMLLGSGGCVWAFRGVTMRPVDRRESVTLAPPAKAHLVDGATIVYRDTVLISDGALRGRGRRYGLTLTDSADVDVVALDSVAALEEFQTHVNEGLSWAVSVASSTAVIGFLTWLWVQFSALRD